MGNAVIFDVDGTLVDSVDLHGRCWHEAFLEFGFQVEFDEVRSQIGKGGDQLMPVFLSPAELERVGAELEAFRSKLWRDKYLSRVRPFDGVRDLFRALKDHGRQIAIASSSKAPELEVYLRVAKVMDLADVRVSADDVEKSKPHPDAIEAALKKLGRPAGPGVWMVGDSPFDALAAKRAGVSTVGLRCGGFPDSDLTEAGCVALYDHPEALLRGLTASPLFRAA